MSQILQSVTLTARLQFVLNPVLEWHFSDVLFDPSLLRNTASLQPRAPTMPSSSTRSRRPSGLDAHRTRRDKEDV